MRVLRTFEDRIRELEERLARIEREGVLFARLSSLPEHELDRICREIKAAQRHILVSSPSTELKISDFQSGTIIKQKGGAESYVVTANYGDYAVAVRPVHISNPSEWEIK